MRRIRTIKLLLLGANLLLGAAIILFAALFLFARDISDLGLPALSWEGARLARPEEDDRPLTTVKNPLQPGSEPPPPGLQLVLLGTLPNWSAFLRSGKDEFVAFVGEGVGPWRLEEVGRDRAVFTQGPDRREIRIDESAPPRQPPVKRPQ